MNRFSPVVHAAGSETGDIRSTSTVRSGGLAVLLCFTLIISMLFAFEGANTASAQTPSAPPSPAGTPGAGPSGAGTQHVKARLVIDQTGIQPAADSDMPSARIGVLLTIEKGWHTYWRNSGEAAIPTKLTWQLPDGWRAGDLVWPAPTKFLEKGNITTYGYRDEVLLWAPLYVPQIVPGPDMKPHLGAKISYLVCENICVPGAQTLDLEVPFSSSLAVGESADYSLFERYSAISPKPLEAVRARPGFEKLQIESGVIADSTDPKRGTAYVLLKSIQLDPQIDPSAEMQLFPAKLAGIALKPPAVQVAKVSDELSDIVLSIPLEAVSGAANGKLNLEGIIVLSSKLATQPTDLPFDFVVPVQAENMQLKSTVATTPHVEGNTSPLRLRTAEHDTAASPGAVPLAPEASSMGLLQALLAAFFAGLILNLMPCVLPIISIKIMGFVSQAQESRRTILISAFTFASGILASFLALALVLISLRGVGVSLGWGFQFQYPQFVASLLIIVFFLSLALFDFYTVNLPFMQSANKAATKLQAPLARHFFDGVLATALSTPCTAPVLGAALAFAFSQPPIVTVLIFLTIGLGLALPYVYLSTNPKLLSLLPQPGAWMYHFRQVMGFLLLGTCAWLMSVLHDLTEKGAVWAAFLMLLLFFFLWVRKVATESKPERGRSPIFNLVFFGALFGSAYWVYPSMIKKRGVEEGLIHWVPYSSTILADAAAKGQTVFIDFTASWCITCKFNEFRIIETRATADAIREHNVLPVKADWTSGDEEITQALRSYGAEGVPLYVILPPDQKHPIVLSTLPSGASLVDALSGRK